MIFSFSCRLTLNSCSIRILLAFFGQRQINKVLAAFKAANELLKRGMTIFRAKNSGTILPADSNIANELANSWALDVFPLDSLPDDAVMMKKRRIAVHGDAGVAAGFRENGYGCVLGAI